MYPDNIDFLQRIKLFFMNLVVIAETGWQASGWP